MTSRQAQKLFFALSVDSLPPEIAAQVRRRIEECPDCQREWILIERTLLTLSTTSQPLIPNEKSLEMWFSCRERVQNGSPHRISPKMRGLIHQPRSEARRSDFFNFLSRPAYGWAALGVATAVFTAAWLLPLSSSSSSASGASAQDPARPEWIALSPAPDERTPSQGATPLVEHHAAMSVAPLDDPVGATLVSYSARTAP